MILKNSTIAGFFDHVKTKQIVGFGASRMPYELCLDYPYLNFESRILFFMDNDESKHNKQLTINGVVIPIISLNEGVDLITEKMVLLITSVYYLEIVEQLNNISKLKQIECYILPLFDQYVPINFNFSQVKKKGFLPRTIHYCWFGGGEPSPNDIKCINSWKEFCPNYEIVRWDEKNYDISKNLYMKQAYDAKKWAFVSDYARLDILYSHGGLYFDTDVEIIKNIDEFLSLSSFCAFDMFRDINTGLGLGCNKEEPLILEMINLYHKISFINEDGSYNEIPCTKHQTRILRRHGLVTDGSLQELKGMVVFPVEFFCPLDLWTGITHVTKNTYTKHHFSSTWWSPEKKQRALLEQKKTRVLLGQIENG
jgi:hypothetical protein